MPTIREYFADARITPQDRGTTAWEQAARRIGGFAEQTAQGLREQGRDIAELWNQAKFGIDLQNAEERNRSRGGGGGLRVGGLHTALDFGRPWGADYGANGRNTNPNVAGPTAYNARAARGITNAAASLPSLVTKLMNGQGLTDDQYKQLGMTRRGSALLAPGGATVDYGKTGVQPNPDISDEQAQKAGMTVDNAPINYARQQPDYPWSPAQFGPPFEAVDKHGVGVGPNIPGGSPLDPDSPNYAGNTQSIGQQIWGGITDFLTPAAPAPAPDDASPTEEPGATFDLSPSNPLE